MWSQMDAPFEQCLWESISVFLQPRMGSYMYTPKLFFIFEQNMHADFAATRASGTRTASRVVRNASRRKFFLLRDALAACKNTANIVVSKFVHYGVCSQ